MPPKSRDLIAASVYVAEFALSISRARMAAVKRKKFDAYLGVHDSGVDYEDGEYVRFVNHRSGLAATMPAADDIDPITVRAVCHSLDVPPPPEASRRGRASRAEPRARTRKARE
jgi:hypothetical protein